MISRRRVFIVPIAATMATMSLAAVKPAARDALALAQRYLSQWEETLIAVVAQEDYTQELQTYRRFASSGQHLWVKDKSRHLTSDVLLLRSPSEHLWLSFRDVMAVDEKAVHDRQRRFDALFAGPAAAVVTSARRIAEEGARYNLGRYGRTINTPTAPLVFLTPTYARNTTWDLDTAGRLEGERLWVLRFDQRKPPFALHIQGDRPYPASGQFWIEPANGRIHQAAILVRSDEMDANVVIRYGAAPSIEGFVPLRMEDGYRARRSEIVTGVATYTKHRLFRTSVRIVSQ